jgi:hypothetical protein
MHSPFSAHLFPGDAHCRCHASSLTSGCTGISFGNIFPERAFLLNLSHNTDWASIAILRRARRRAAVEGILSGSACNSNDHRTLALPTCSLSTKSCVAGCCFAAHAHCMIHIMKCWVERGTGMLRSGSLHCCSSSSHPLTHATVCQSLISLTVPTHCIRCVVRSTWMADQLPLPRSGDVGNSMHLTPCASVPFGPYCWTLVVVSAPLIID